MSLVVRPYDAGSRLDRDFCVSHWLMSWAESSYGRAHGAHRRPSTARSNWWAANEGYVRALLEHEETSVIVSANDRDTVMGFACVSPGVIHYVLVHRDCHRGGYSRDLYAALLGDRWDEPQMVSHELVDLNEARVSMPRNWILDVYLNARRSQHAA